MIVERDIAGFALPFAAGTVLWTSISSPPSFLSAALLLTAATGVSILLHPIHKSLNSITLRGVVIILGLVCGVLTGLTHETTASISPGIFTHLYRYASGFNEGLKEAIRNIPFTDKSANALISALITGDRSMLAKDITRSFRASGASHILALSGFHLGIIYGLMKAGATVWGKRIASRATCSMFIVITCGFYTLATGANPSTVRALLFILLGEAAAMTGRFKNTGTILCAALLLQLTINPSSVKSVGFMLSYAAMAGIAYIYPHLRNYWPETDSHLTYKCLKWIWNSAALSIACQVTTAPIAYLYFGTFPKYFLLTNLIALPLTSLIIPASLCVLLLSSTGICPGILIRATEYMIRYLIQSLEIIASL